MNDFEKLYNEAVRLFHQRNYSGTMKILDDIIQNEKEYIPIYLSQVYVTYASCLMNSVDKLNKQSSIKAIEYLRKALELKPDNKVAPKLLFQCLFIDEEMFMEAMEVFAKYNLNFGEDSCNDLSSKERQEDKLTRFFLYECVQRRCIDLCRSQPRLMDELYELHEKYFGSYHYTDFLVTCAEGYGNFLKSYTLINDYLNTVKQEEIGIEKYFNLLCQQLFYVSTVGNKEDIRRILNKTEDFFVNNGDYIKNPDIRYSYYTNKASALLKMDEIKALLEMYDNLPYKEMDNTLLHNIGEAYLRKQQFDEAVRIGSAACFLKADETDYMLLAKAYMGLEDYEHAIEYLEKGIVFLKSEKKKYSCYSYKNNTAEAINCNELDEQLAGFYAILIQALVGKKDIKAAKAVKQIAEEDTNINTLKETLDSSLFLMVEDALNDDIAVITKEKNIIEKKLMNADKKISVFRKNISKWYKELLRIQILDSGAEVTDEDWEENYQETFSKIINNVAYYCIRTSSKKNEINNKINRTFPGISKQGRNFLSTAERMYFSFCEEKSIDFAPVMVEYCRTIEVLLKDYLERSEIYADEYVKAKAYNHQGATFGAATNTLKNVSGPLDKFRRDLNNIRKARNNSAHINVNKEPDVTYIREYIWNSPLLNTLCGL